MSKQVFGLLGLLAGMIWSSYALAQVPVIDSANLTQAQQTAANTKQILATDQAILSNVQKTLQAVTGNRSSVAQGSLAQMALGGGFSMGQAPSLGSVISGGPLSFAGLGGNSQSIISTLISGLQLVKSPRGRRRPSRRIQPSPTRPTRRRRLSASSTRHREP
jgi:hypothetical protein